MRHPRALAGWRGALDASGFRTLWVAAVVSRAGDAVMFVALPLLALAATGSPAAVALLVLAEVVSLAVGSALAQLVVDRTPPRHLLVTVDAVRAGAVVLLVAWPVYPVALGVASVLAVGSAWFSPTVAAMVPRLMAAPLLPAANALLWAAGVALQLVGAPIGGLLGASGLGRVAFAADAASFAVSALILSRLPILPPLATGSPWRQIPELLRAVRAVPVLRPLLGMQALASLAAGAPSALLVVLAERAYGLDGAAYGLWLAVIGAGALLGPVVMPALARLRAERAVPAAYLLRGAGDVGLGLLDNGLAGAGLLFLYGLNTSSGSVAYQHLVQTRVPPALRGRAFGALDLTWQLARLASLGTGSLLVARLGVRDLFIAGGLLLALAGAAGMAWLGRLPPHDGAWATPS
ncbi:MAG: MFS transporter [Candidatus Dormibacteria bacterium]